MPSGEKGSPVTLKAAPGAKPVLTPAIPFSAEWSVYKGKIYVADIGDAVYDIDPSNMQVFLDGVSMVEARYPNMGPDMSSIMDYKRAVAGNGTNSNTIVAPDDMPDGIKGATLVVWPGDNGLSGWVAFTSPVYLTNGKTIRLSQALDNNDPLTGQNAYQPVQGNPFYVVGALPLLDAPGEYFYDSAAGKLYFYAPDGGDPGRLDISLRSDRHFAINMPGCGYVIVDGFDIYGGGINMRGAHDCTVQNSSIRYAEHFYASGYASGSYLNGFFVQGDNNVIKRCEIGPTAGNGVTIRGDGNMITDCVIHDCNYAGNDFAGIYAYGSKRLEISHNSIYSSARAHIFFAIYDTFTDSVIKNNHFKNHSTLNSDCGPFYTWSSYGAGTQMFNNFVECGDQNDSGSMTKLREGLYVDNRSSNYIVHHNIVIGGHTGLRTNLPNEGTQFYNNTVIGADYGYGLYAYPNEETSAKGVVCRDNLFVDIKGVDITYYGWENGRQASYQGSFSENGGVPVPGSGINPVEAGGNARGTVDSQYRPTGDTPDIGAIPRGGGMFDYGASWRP